MYAAIVEKRQSVMHIIKRCAKIAQFFIIRSTCQIMNISQIERRIRRSTDKARNTRLKSQSMTVSQKQKLKGRSIIAVQSARIILRSIVKGQKTRQKGGSIIAVQNTKLI